MNETRKFNRYRKFKLYQPIQLPEQSRLYSLEPIGLQTSFTESLSSYLLRLAEAHCVTPKKLIMWEIAPLILGDRYTTEIVSKGISALLPNCDAKPGINGMREMTTVVTNALGELTLREDLSFLSLITWKGIIEEQKLFRSKKAICPQCFEEWKLQQKIIYEPLLWSFKDVTHCLRHNCQLIDSCPHCNRPLKAIANFSRLGFCSRCKSWLGSNLTQDLSCEIDDVEYSTIEKIGELIAVTPTLKSSLSLPSLINKLKFVHVHFKSVFTRSLDIFQPFSSHDSSFGKYVKQLEIITEHKNDQPLNLIKLIVPICYKSKITLSQFLLYDVFALSKTLQENLDIERANNSSPWHWRL